MLQWTLRRATAVTARHRIVVVVARDHELWWRSQLAELAPENIVTQPCNRGTAVGILLPLLRILARDPAAEILVLPSDHYVEKERALNRILFAALGLARRFSTRVVLVGVKPDRDRTDYGWILPEGHVAGGTACEVAAFREKPTQQAVARLVASGAVVNSLMVASHGETLQQLIAEAAPGLAERFQDCIRTESSSSLRLDRLYASLESIDFSRQVLEPRPDHLLVQPVVDDCGWSDLGTPERLQSYFSAHTATAPIASRAGLTQTR